MALRKFKPITAGTRWRIGNAYAEVTTNVPEKSLVESKKGTGGNEKVGLKKSIFAKSKNAKMQFQGCWRKLTYGTR